jgi:type II secretory pathway component PulF
MPYYRWEGIKLDGSIRTGIFFAPSKEALDTYLFEKEIALLKASEKRIFSFLYPICQETKATVFAQLATLLTAGIRLPSALLIAASANTHNPLLQKALFGCHESVKKGIPWALIAHDFPILFAPLDCQLIAIGQESGTLAQALSMLATHTKERARFTKKVRSILAMPGITALFIIFLLGIFILFLVPQFASFLKSFNQEIPRSMRTLLSINTFLKSKRIIYLIASVGIIIYGAKRFFKTTHGIQLQSHFMQRLPIISTLVNQSFSIYFFNALGLLINNGLPIAYSLKLINQTIVNPHHKRIVSTIADVVFHGMSLSLALSEHPQFFSIDDCALIKTGEESGLVASIAQLIAQKHSEALETYSNRLATYLQPLCILLLGVLVGTIIAQVYGPIMHISMKI